MRRRRGETRKMFGVWTEEVCNLGGKWLSGVARENGLETYRTGRENGFVVRW